MGPILLGTICEIAWNQGVDLYGAKDNRFLAAVEYISKYNLGHEVPFTTYVYVYGHPGKEQRTVQSEISSHARGVRRPGWDLVLNHYVSRKGMSAPWTARYAEEVRPEGGGFNYGGNSGGFDGLGFTTLTHTRESNAESAPPSALRPHVEGRTITLSWAGSAAAESYHVRRAIRQGGPYETLAETEADTLFHIDSGLAPGTTYYYLVSANHGDGSVSTSEEAAVTATRQLTGKVFGTEGSYQDSGATKEVAFDDSLQNYFDGPEGQCFVGLDLGEDVTAVPTEVRYCPRPGFPSRMVGGKFQGARTLDSGFVDLFTIQEAPPEGELTVTSLETTEAFRYLRYLGPPESAGNVAEIQFFGELRGLETPAAN
jgi:hypothetical protein